MNYYSVLGMFAKTDYFVLSVASAWHNLLYTSDYSCITLANSEWQLFCMKLTCCDTYNSAHGSGFSVLGDLLVFSKRKESWAVMWCGFPSAQSCRENCAVLRGTPSWWAVTEGNLAAGVFAAREWEDWEHLQKPLPWVADDSLNPFCCLGGIIPLFMLTQLGAEFCSLALRIVSCWLLFCMQWSICFESSKPWKKIHELPSLLLQWAVLTMARLEGKGLHSKILLRSQLSQKTLKAARKT